LENEPELFFNGKYEEPVVIKTNNATLHATLKEGGALILLIEEGCRRCTYKTNNNLNFSSLTPEKYLPFIRKYSFCFYSWHGK
jgi:hypothetical protein